MKKIFTWTVFILQFLMGAILAVMIGANVLQLLTRYFISYVLTWVEDLSVLCLYWMCALGTPMAWLLGAHVTMNVSDAIISKKIQECIWVIIQILGAIFGCGLAVVGIRCAKLNAGYVMSAMGFDEMWRYIPFACCGILLTFCAVLLLVQYVIDKKQGKGWNSWQAA